MTWWCVNFSRLNYTPKNFLLACVPRGRKDISKHTLLHLQKVGDALRLGKGHKDQVPGGGPPALLSIKKSELNDFFPGGIPQGTGVEYHAGAKADRG